MVFFLSEIGRNRRSNTIKDELKAKMKNVEIHSLTKEDQGLLEGIKRETQELT